MNATVNATTTLFHNTTTTTISATTIHNTTTLAPITIVESLPPSFWALIVTSVVMMGLITWFLLWIAGCSCRDCHCKCCKCQRLVRQFNKGLQIVLIDKQKDNDEKEEEDWWDANKEQDADGNLRAEKKSVNPKNKNPGIPK